MIVESLPGKSWNEKVEFRHGPLPEFQLIFGLNDNLFERTVGNLTTEAECLILKVEQVAATMCCPNDKIHPSRSTTLPQDSAHVNTNQTLPQHFTSAAFKHQWHKLL